MAIEGQRDAAARLTSSRAQPPEAHFKLYLKLLRKHRWLILAIFVVVTLTGALWTFTRVPIYQATATVLIEPEPPKVLNIQDVTPLAGSGPDYYQTQYELIRSRAIVEKAAENLKERIPGMSAGVLFGGLSIEPRRGTRLVAIRFEHPDPSLAANAIASAYVRHNLDMKFKGAREAMTWLNEQMADLKTKVQQSSVALQNYRVRAGVLGLNEQRQITTSKIMESSKGYLEAQAQRLSIESKLRELQRIAKDKAGASTLFSVTDNPLIQKLRSEAAELDVQRAQLMRTYKEKHPEVQKIDARIQYITQRYDAEIQTMLRALQTELQVAKAREDTLAGNVAQLKREAQDVNEKEIQYLSLQRENDAVQQLYDAVLKRLKETGITGGLETNNLRIVEDATTPGQPIYPRKARTLASSAALGLLLAIGAAVLLEYLDTTVKTPEDIERFLGLPVIAIVPTFEKR